MRILDPKIRAERLSSIDLLKLRREGYQGILIDLDNTIVPWRQDQIPEETVVFFEQAKELGFKICLFTNARAWRALPISKTLGIRCFPEAKKPSGARFRLVLCDMGLKPRETLMIGDQIFTDMLGGNRAGCCTVLVPPLHPREFIGTKCLRLLERLCGYRQYGRR